jgi:hypothetical protein
MTRSECLQNLKRLRLFDTFNCGELTYLTLSCKLSIKFKLLQKKLHEKGYPGLIKKDSKVSLPWLPIIFKIKGSKQKVTRQRKPRTKRESEDLYLYGQISKRYWLDLQKEKQEIKERAKKIPRVRIISIPMGGKVK